MVQFRQLLVDVLFVKGDTMPAISVQNISSGSPVSSVDITQYIDNLNSYYQLVFDSVQCPSASSTAYLIIQVSDDGGSTYKTTNYVNSLLSGVTSGFALGMLHDAITSNDYTMDGGLYLNNLYSGVLQPSATGTSNSFATPILGPVLNSIVISSVYNGSSLSVNALRIKSSDGNDISGNFYLYAF